MKFDINEWLGPKIVTTPNIEDDINEYLGNEILNNWKITSDIKLKETIIFIVERLDFISHLKSFGKYVDINSSKTTQIINQGNVSIKIVTDYKFEWNGHDYSGVNFDIEALVLYLLLSCIDAIQSQSQYKSPFDWLKEKSSTYQNKNEDAIKNLLDQDKKVYSDYFGLSKNFVKAFTSDISDNLIKEISDELIIVKCKNGELDSGSLNNWNSKQKKEKAKKIASFLYELRSKYTHKNIRSFIPSKNPIFLGIDGEVLLCKKGYDLEDLLHRILKNLCLNKLKTHENTE